MPISTKTIALKINARTIIRKTDRDNVLTEILLIIKIHEEQKNYGPGLQYNILFINSIDDI